MVRVETTRDKWKYVCELESSTTKAKEGGTPFLTKWYFCGIQLYYFKNNFDVVSAVGLKILMCRYVDLLSYNSFKHLNSFTCLNDESSCAVMEFIERELNSNVGYLPKVQLYFEGWRKNSLKAKRR